MILSGEKKEEYREINPYWIGRLRYPRGTRYPVSYTHIKFTNGYGKSRPAFIIEYSGLYEAVGRAEWGELHRIKGFLFWHLAKL